MSAAYPSDDEPITEAEVRAALLRGLRNALLIELVLAVGVLLGMLLVAWWPSNG